MAAASRLIEDYLWNVKEYDEWDQRYIAETAEEVLKQEKFKRLHEQQAKDCWNALVGVWGRRVIVDGVVYYIRDEYPIDHHGNAAEGGWNKLIQEQKQGVVA